MMSPQRVDISNNITEGQLPTSYGILSRDTAAVLNTQNIWQTLLFTGGDSSFLFFNNNILSGDDNLLNFASSLNESTSYYVKL